MNCVNVSEDILVRDLRNKGISPSPQRLAVFGFLRANPIHPTAETIMREVREKVPTLSLTTVYNTLKLLVRHELVQEVIIEDGELRFDADMRSHAHFKCLECGKVYDLFPEKEDVFPPPCPGLPEGFTVSGVHICLRGRCRGCNGQ